MLYAALLTVVAGDIASAEAVRPRQNARAKRSLLRISVLRPSDNTIQNSRGNRDGVKV
jgi:hypothetical protein